MSKDINVKENIIELNKKDLEKEGYDFSKYSTEELYLDFTETAEAVIGLTQPEKLFIKIKDTYFYNKLDIKDFLYHFMMNDGEMTDNMRIELLIMENIYKSKFCDKWYKTKYIHYLQDIKNNKNILNNNELIKNFNARLIKSFESIKTDKKLNTPEYIKDFSIGRLFFDYKDLISFSSTNKDVELKKYREMFFEFYNEIYNYVNNEEILKILKDNDDEVSELTYLSSPLYSIYKEIDLIHNKIQND